MYDEGESEGLDKLDYVQFKREGRYVIHLTRRREECSAAGDEHDNDDVIGPRTRPYRSGTPRACKSQIRSSRLWVSGKGE